jgi:flagellar capping protein FliD
VAVQGEGELLDSLSSGKVKLTELKKEQLPAEWQKLDDAELKAKIQKQQKERAELQAQIVKLSKDRDDYVAKNASACRRRQSRFIR